MGGLNKYKYKIRVSSDPQILLISNKKLTKFNIKILILSLTKVIFILLI